MKMKHRSSLIDTKSNSLFATKVTDNTKSSKQIVGVDHSIKFSFHIPLK